MLKGKKKTVTEVDYREIDRLITKEYGQEYQCVPYEEWSNDSSHSFNVEKGELDEYEKQDIEKWKANREGHYRLDVFLKDLCNKGKIEPGEYLINICW